MEKAELPDIHSIHKRIRSIEQLKSKVIVDANFPVYKDSFVYNKDFNQRQVSVKQHLQECKELKKQLKQWQHSRLEADSFLFQSEPCLSIEKFGQNLISLQGGSGIKSFVSLAPKAPWKGEVVDLDRSFVKKDITEMNRKAVLNQMNPAKKKKENSLNKQMEQRRNFKLRMVVNQNHVRVKLPTIKKPKNLHPKS